MSANRWDERKWDEQMAMNVGQESISSGTNSATRRGREGDATDAPRELPRASSAYAVPLVSQACRVRGVRRVVVRAAPSYGFDVPLRSRRFFVILYRHICRTDPVARTHAMVMVSRLRCCSAVVSALARRLRWSRAPTPQSPHASPRARPHPPTEDPGP